MPTDIHALRVLLLAMTGWAHREHQRAIEYLVEENRVLKEQLGNRRLRLTDDQRRRLAARGKILGRTTIARTLKADGIKPAPDRPSSWRTFLRAHRGQIAATDFFTTEVWTHRGLTTVYTLFLIDLRTRRIHIGGSITHPDGSFMAQVARNLTDAVNGFLLPHRHLICDRDAKFTAHFQQVLRSAGVATVLTPSRAPNCNGYAERFVRSIKEDCLDRMIFFGVGSLRRAIAEHVEHYHEERLGGGFYGTIDARPSDGTLRRSCPIMRPRRPTCSLLASVVVHQGAPKSEPGSVRIAVCGGGRRGLEPHTPDTRLPPTPHLAGRAMLPADPARTRSEQAQRPRCKQSRIS
jgi:transposase InsO family protein